MAENKEESKYTDQISVGSEKLVIDKNDVNVEDIEMSEKLTTTNFVRKKNTTRYLYYYVNYSINV